MQVYLDNQQFNQKPKNKEIGIITNKIYKQKAYLNLRELAKEIAEKGRTVMLATYIANLKQAELEQQSLSNSIDLTKKIKRIGNSKLINVVEVLEFKI